MRKNPRPAQQASAGTPPGAPSSRRPPGTCAARPYLSRPCRTLSDTAAAADTHRTQRPEPRSRGVLTSLQEVRASFRSAAAGASEDQSAPTAGRFCTGFWSGAGGAAEILSSELVHVSCLCARRGRKMAPVTFLPRPQAGCGAEAPDLQPCPRRRALSPLFLTVVLTSVSATYCWKYGCPRGSNTCEEVAPQGRLMQRDVV